MKKTFFAIQIEVRLLKYDFVRYIKKQFFSEEQFKKFVIHILTIASFPVGFWLAFQIIKGFTER